MEVKKQFGQKDDMIIVEGEMDTTRNSGVVPRPDNKHACPNCGFEAIGNITACTEVCNNCGARYDCSDM